MACTTLPDSIPFTYSQPGLYFATATLTDGQGKQYTDTIAINVLSLQALDTLLQSKWSGMKGALANNDINTALNAIEFANRGRYRDLLTALRSQLSQIGSILTDISFVSMDGTQAEYQMIRVDNGVSLSYFVLFVMDEDGIWRLEFF